MSAEAAVVRNYIDWMINLPWYDYSDNDKTLSEAKEILESQHYGLKDVKERMVEYLAVRSLLGDQADGKGTILCLAGRQGLVKQVWRSLLRSL